MASYLISAAIIGIIATSVMSSVLLLITRLNISNVDMIRAIGSIYTKAKHTALLPGVLVHFTAGIMFCHLYLILFHIFPISIGNPFIYVVLGTLSGMVHGVIVSLLLMILVAEHHPLKEFRRAGFDVAFYHLLAHVVYGFIIGFVYYLSVGGLIIPFNINISQLM